jgi:hypothetical protein
MVTFFEASLDTISVHHVGNQSQSEMYALSDHPLVLKDELISSLLKQYFLTPFEKSVEVYHLAHSSGDLNLNELYHFATQVFDVNIPSVDLIIAILFASIIILAVL